MKVVTCEKCGKFAEYRRDGDFRSATVVCETCNETFQATRAQIAEGEKPTREEWKDIAGNLCDALAALRLVHAVKCPIETCKWCQKGATAHEEYQKLSDRERLSGGSV